jgi:hypothetical protein
MKGEVAAATAKSGKYFFTSMITTSESNFGGSGNLISGCLTQP